MILRLSLALVLILLFSGNALAEFRINSFKSIPVLDNGRLKPLDTYARSVLTQFSGRDHYGKQEATDWLACVFFKSQTTSDDKIFLINNPEIATALGISPEDHRRYAPEQLIKSYSKLEVLHEAALKIPERERSLVENEILRVFDNVNLYAELSHSFVFALPQKDFTILSRTTKTELGLPLAQDQFSFIDIALRAKALQKLFKGLQSKSPSQFTKDESELLQVTGNLFRWSKAYKDLPFNVIPSRNKDRWLSPWDALTSDFSNSNTVELLLLWSQMATSFAQDNKAQFDLVLRSYQKIIPLSLSKSELKSFNKFIVELFYHVSSPFTWAIMFYILTFVFFVFSFSSSKKIWYQWAMASAFIGFAIHVLGLAMRIVIMGRPPVSSLYETFIFVGAIAVFLGLAIEHFNRQWLGFVTAAISGAVLLFIAHKYSAEGDTLKVLIAVLNSNFWLATHVTSITMGYAATCVGGVLGHIWLIQAVFNKDRKVLDQTYKTTLGILGVALTLTFLGTNLGGIWADQSWGRFWGWDPKENGALMIVLWIALLFHAKIA